MDHQGKFRCAASQLGIPDEEISRFGRHLRLSIRLSGGSGGPPVGQFGGVPRLPVGVPWPSAGHSPLPFVFSVDCGALPRVDGFGLPSDGTLLFFLDHEEDHLDDGGGERSYARVLYVQAGTDTVAAEPPGPGCVGEEYAVSATLLAELPPWFEADEDADEGEDDRSPFQEQLARDLERDIPHLDQLRALAHDLWPADEGLASACIGGYVDDEVITSIAEQTLAGLEQAGDIVIPVAKWYSHVEKEKHRLTSEWMALARFPAADEFYYGSFVLRHDDLAAARVDRALSVTEFTE
ncbi:DUF1963 domain-containing protein [Streptomyces sp. CSMPJR101]|uniref:DUF1963 domain-containing protein n=1 Tax=Streptomyces sp. CSMPJR101 TaxID=1279378 RepID=UPI00385223BD